MKAARRVLWVADDFSPSCPQTKTMVESLPALLKKGWEVTVWAFRAEGLPSGVKVELLSPSLFPRWISHLWDGWRFLAHARNRPPFDLVHTIGSHYPGADVVTIQFFNPTWFQLQADSGIRSIREFVQWILNGGDALLDIRQIRDPRSRCLVSVSEGIARIVRQWDPACQQIEVIPNGYDPQRFSPEIRQEKRLAARTSLKFTDKERVFAFCSQGHHERKGFWLAAEALIEVQKARKDSIRFLVIGGNPKTIARLNREWQQRWGAVPDWVIWTGDQKDPIPFLSAADAFLFPSQFEAFSLAEIEAAALGLPLLITSHPGSEMILKEGVSGLRLDPNPKSMSATLISLLEGNSSLGAWTPKGWEHFQAGVGRALPVEKVAERYDALYSRLLETAITS